MDQVTKTMCLKLFQSSGKEKAGATLDLGDLEKTFRGFIMRPMIVLAILTHEEALSATF